MPVSVTFCSSENLVVNNRNNRVVSEPLLRYLIGADWKFDVLKTSTVNLQYQYVLNPYGSRTSHITCRENLYKR